MRDDLKLLKAELLPNGMQLWKFDSEKFGDMRIIRGDTIPEVMQDARQLKDLYSSFQLILIEKLVYGDWVLDKQWGFSAKAAIDALFDEDTISFLINTAKNFIYASAYGYPDSEELQEAQIKLMGYHGP